MQHVTWTNQAWQEQTHAGPWTIRWARRPSGAIRGKVGRVTVARITETFDGLEIHSLLPAENGSAALERRTTWEDAQQRAGELLLDFFVRLTDKSP
ncbi:hypothetical protein Aph01nite_12950 [Acrocarpospora phusangensis]|uniref:Uncharacterized protein n=1 Tax=Acrocarpospora phusangensis TaxID=1070424 RepID=A0A919UNT3_9ACTN|nr:hypothetical protein Aph01nite_12950 [Acrocarpospora phusangensis]